MSTQITLDYLANGGVDSIKGTVDNGTKFVQYLGGSLIALVLAALGISVMFGAFSEGGAMRKNLGKVATVAVGALVLGGGAVIGPMLVNTGQELPRSQTPAANTRTVN